MRNVLLFSLVAAIAFFVTVEVQIGSQAGFHGDFEPASPAQWLQVSQA